MPSFNTELSFWVTHLLTSGHTSYALPHSVLLVSTFPLDWPVSHLRGTLFLYPYFFLISSLFWFAPLLFPLPRNPQQSQVPFMYHVSPVSPSFPKLHHLRDVFLMVMTSALQHWPHFCSATNGIYQKIFNKTLVLRHSDRKWGRLHRTLKFYLFFSSFISERKWHKNTTVTTCLITLFCQLLSQKMLYFKGSQPVQRKAVEYGNVFIHLVSHPCSFEFQIMKPIALVLFPE